MSENEYLAHYGVKGMKWGVRKDRVSGTGSMRKAKTDGFKITSDHVATAAKIGVTVVAATVSGGLGGAMASSVLNNEIVIGAATSAVNAAITAIGSLGVDVVNEHAKKAAVKQITKRQVRTIAKAIARPGNFEEATKIGTKAGAKTYDAMMRKKRKEDANA